MDELQVNIRQRIVDILNLIASKEDQIDYQRRAPGGVCVASELFNQWDDWYHPDGPHFVRAFTLRELDALKLFNDVLEQVSRATPQILPPIEEFVQTPEWLMLADAAVIAQAVVRRSEMPNQ